MFWQKVNTLRYSEGGDEFCILYQSQKNNLLYLPYDHFLSNTKPRKHSFHIVVVYTRGKKEQHTTKSFRNMKDASPWNASDTCRCDNPQRSVHKNEEFTISVITKVLHCFVFDFLFFWVANAHHSGCWPLHICSSEACDSNVLALWGIGPWISFFAAEK